jgi:hypothetical protein
MHILSLLGRELLPAGWLFSQPSQQLLLVHCAEGEMLAVARLISLRIACLSLLITRSRCLLGLAGQESLRDELVSLAVAASARYSR